MASVSVIFHLSRSLKRHLSLLRLQSDEMRTRILKCCGKTQMKHVMRYALLKYDMFNFPGKTCKSLNLLVKKFTYLYVSSTTMSGVRNKLITRYFGLNDSPASS
jgi:hypothetical protein